MITLPNYPITSPEISFRSSFDQIRIRTQCDRTYNTRYKDSVTWYNPVITGHLVGWRNAEFWADLSSSKLFCSTFNCYSWSSVHREAGLGQGHDTYITSTANWVLCVVVVTWEDCSRVGDRMRRWDNLSLDSGQSVIDCVLNTIEMLV